MCERWIEPFKGFDNFVDDMSPRPPEYSLDRIDNDKGYSPDNCRWATRTMQQRNLSTTRKVTIEGVEYIAADLAEKAGLKTDTIIDRAAQNLSYDEIISPNKRVYTPGLALGGKASGAKKQALTHCPNGHEYNERNTRVDKRGWRSCRVCARERERIRRGAKHYETPPQRIIEIDGVQRHVDDLEREFGVKADTIWRRFQRGWSLAMVLSKDPQWNNTESQKKAVAAHAEQKKALTHCKRGHLLSGENLYEYKGRRHCRTCRRAQDKYLYYQKKRPIEDFL